MANDKSLTSILEHAHEALIELNTMIRTLSVAKLKEIDDDENGLLQGFCESWRKNSTSFRNSFS